MQTAGASVPVRDVEVGGGQHPLGSAGVEGGVHDRGCIAAVAQPQGVAQLVRHHRLEVVLAGADLRRVAAGVEVPAVDDCDFPGIGGAAEHAIGIAAHGTGGVHV